MSHAQDYATLVLVLILATCMLPANFFPDVKVWLLNKLAKRRTRYIPPKPRPFAYEPEPIAKSYEFPDRDASPRDIKESGFPHCDPNILHAPGECEFCDMYPRRQFHRIESAVNFTNHDDLNRKPCPSLARRTAAQRDAWAGNRAHPKQDSKS